MTNQYSLLILLISAVALEAYCIVFQNQSFKKLSFLRTIFISAALLFGTAHIYNSVLISKGVVVLDKTIDCNVLNGSQVNGAANEPICLVNGEFSHSISGDLLIKTETGEVFCIAEESQVSTTTTSTRLEFFKDWTSPKVNDVSPTKKSLPEPEPMSDLGLDSFGFPALCNLTSGAAFDVGAHGGFKTLTPRVRDGQQIYCIDKSKVRMMMVEKGIDDAELEKLILTYPELPVRP